MESFYLDENSLKYTAIIIACSTGYIVKKYFKMDNYKEYYNSKLIKKLINIYNIISFYRT